MKPAAALISGDRLHLQHGPIDLIIGVDGARALAFDAARARFETVLDELVPELPVLRRPILPGAQRPSGKIARRMFDACWPLSSQFATPMAAVAGSVADEILSTIVNAASPQRAYVNNGGDISVFMSKNEEYKTSIRSHEGLELGRIALTHGDGIGGIASSGRHGRSHSLGIADSVTVLATSAAAADVAATLIGNAVDLPDHPGVARTPARALDSDSDLGDMPVVTGCPPLADADIQNALNAGEHRARAFLQAGHIKAAALFLQGGFRLVGTGITTKDLAIERAL